MNHLKQLTRLSANLDRQCTELGLQMNPAGQYPWQEAQEKRRNRRIIAGATGAAAIGAGAYGANKGIGALKARYGVASGGDALKVGAAEAAQKVKGAVAPAVDKAKTAMAPAVNKMKDVAAPAMTAVKRKYAAGKLSAVRGKAAGQGMGKMVKRVARAVIHASVGPNAPKLVALEAQLDKALKTL